jgi:hypothetical protein
MQPQFGSFCSLPLCCTTTPHLQARMTLIAFRCAFSSKMLRFQGGEGVYNRLCNAISDLNNKLCGFHGANHWPAKKVREGGLFNMWKDLMRKEANKRKYVCLGCMPPAYCFVVWIFGVYNGLHLVGSAFSCLVHLEPASFSRVCFMFHIQQAITGIQI